MQKSRGKRLHLNEKEAALNDISSATENVTPEPVVPLEEIKTKKKIVKKTSTKHHTYKCNQCNFKGNNQITVNKHMNKKHDQVKTHQDGKKDVVEFECSLCEEKFSDIKDLEVHTSEHLEDIKEMDIDSLKSGHDIYECTLCPFESGHNDNIREHLVEHVLASKSNEKKCDQDNVKTSDKEEGN